MQVTLIKLCFSFLLLVSTTAWAANTSVAPDSSLGKTLTALADIKGFSTPFKQTLHYAEGGKREYTGELAVLRPGMFRWRYIKPYEQLFVSNGDGVWLYEPDLLQAQKLQDLGEVDPVVMQLLDGRIGLKDVQVVALEKLDGVDAWHVRLGEGYQAVEVWLGVQGNQLVWIESRDVLGNANRLYLLDMQTTPPNPEIFEFVAPEGVDVIGALS